MHTDESITMTAPLPSMLPFAASESKSSFVSRSFSLSIGALTPPGMTAFNGLSEDIPPQWSNISSLKVAPIGSS